MAQDLRARLEQSLANENVQKYLEGLKVAEGTAKSSYRGSAPFASPYQVAGGGSAVITDLSKFHNQSWGFEDKTGKKGKSSAAGAYQFLGKTWDDAARNLGLTDFSPKSQDLAALYLMHQRGSLADVEAGDFTKAISKDNKTWASLPGSPYNQQTRSPEFMAQALGQSSPTKTASVGTGVAPNPARDRGSFSLHDGTSMVPKNESHQQQLANIAALGETDPMKARLAKLSMVMPKDAATEQALFGNGNLPTLFDKEIERLVATV